MDCINTCHGGTQTVASEDDFLDWERFYQQVHVVSNFLLVQSIIQIESVVDVALFTTFERFHPEGEILYPVLSVCAASP